MVDKLTDVRDAILVVAGSCYVCGYLVWAFIAWRQDFGPLPLLEAQYLVAGIPVVALSAAVIGFAWVMSKRIVPDWDRWLGERSTITKILITYAIFIVFYGPFTWVFMKPALTGTIAEVSPSQMVLVLGLSYIGSIFAGPSTLMDALRSGESQGSARHGLLARLLNLQKSFFKSLDGFARRMGIYIMPPLIAVVALAWFIDAAYGHIPQEFGGAQPRCAYIDLKTGDLSNETLAALGLSAGVRPKVRPTGKLQVAFAGRSQLYIYAVGSGQAIEISRSAISAVRWCSN